MAMTEQDQEIVNGWHKVAEQLKKRYLAELQSHPAPGVAVITAYEKRLYHQYLHYMEKHRNQLSDDMRRQLDEMDKPEDPSMMYLPEPELGL